MLTCICYIAWLQSIIIHTHIHAHTFQTDQLLTRNVDMQVVNDFMLYVAVPIDEQFTVLGNGICCHEDGNDLHHLLYI